MGVKELLLICLLTIGFSYCQPALPTKVCGNEDCSEVLFEGKVIQTQPSEHPMHLDYRTKGVVVKVNAVKFSDRVDIWQGQIDDGDSLFFYRNHIEHSGYHEFLKKALADNRLLYPANREDPSRQARTNVKHAPVTARTLLEMDLYIIEKDAALARGEPAPPLPSPPAQKGKGHSHSHSHSHGHSHDANGDHHSHSHGPAEQPEPAKVEQSNPLRRKLANANTQTDTAAAGQNIVSQDNTVIDHPAEPPTSSIDPTPRMRTVPPADSQPVAINTGSPQPTSVPAPTVVEPVGDIVENKISPPVYDSNVAPSVNDNAAPPMGGGQAAPPVEGNQVAPPMGGGQAVPPVEGNQAAPPMGDGQAVPPVEGNQVASPVEENQVAPPMGGGQASSSIGRNQAVPPTGGSQVVPPVADDQAAPSAGGDQVAQSVTDDQVAPPAGGGQVVPPVADDQAAPPAGGDQVAPPAGGDQVAPSVTDDQVAPPVADDQVASPADDNLPPPMVDDIVNQIVNVNDNKDIQQRAAHESPTASDQTTLDPTPSATLPESQPMDSSLPQPTSAPAPTVVEPTPQSANYLPREVTEAPPIDAGLQPDDASTITEAPPINEPLSTAIPIEDASPPPESVTPSTVTEIPHLVDIPTLETILQMSTTTPMSMKSIEDVVPADASPTIHPHTEIRDELGQEYCVEGTCDRTLDQLDPHSNHSWLLTVKSASQPVVSVLRYTLKTIRSLFPSNIRDMLSDVDDLGLLLIFFIPTSIIVHLICGCLDTSKRAQVRVTNRQYVNVCNEKKALEVENEQLKKTLGDRVQSDQNSVDVRNVREQYEAELDDIKLNYADVLAQNSSLLNQIEKMKEQLERDSVAACSASEQENEWRVLLDDLKTQNRSLEEQLIEYRRTCEEAREMADRLDTELDEKITQLKKIEEKNLELDNIFKEKTIELDEKESTVERLESENKVLDEQVTELSSIIEEIRKEEEIRKTNNEDRESGGKCTNSGEGGWSDIGDWDVNNGGNKNKAKSPEKPAVPSPDQLMDVAKLRSKVRHLEADLQLIKSDAKKALEAQTRSESQRNALEIDVSRLKEKLDYAEEERRDLLGQIKRLTNMLETKDTELRSKESQLNKQREININLHEEIRNLKEQTHLREEKSKDMDQDIKRLRRDAEKTESRHYHETRELKAEVEHLKAEIIRYRQTAQSARPAEVANVASPLDVISNNSNSSEAEMLGINTTLATGKPIPPPSLPTPVYDYGAMGAGWAALATSDPDEPPVTVPRPRSRPKGDPGPSGGTQRRPSSPRPEKEEKRRDHRRRARSRGRYSPTVGYPMPAQLYDPYAYSSPGSAGGPSPPPEMALISGVPPAGVTKRPTASRNRPKSAYDGPS